MLREGFRESEIISEHKILTIFPIALSIHLIPILINNMPSHKFYEIEYYWKLSSVGATSRSRFGD